MRFQIDPEVVIAIEVQARRADVEEFEVEDIELMAMRQTAHQVPPYQRLLTAALRGEHDLFASQETIEEAWRIVDPILGRTRRSTSTSAAAGARPRPTTCRRTTTGSRPHVDGADVSASGRPPSK